MSSSSIALSAERRTTMLQKKRHWIFGNSEIRTKNTNCTEQPPANVNHHWFSNYYITHNGPRCVPPIPGDVPQSKFAIPGNSACITVSGGSGRICARFERTNVTHSKGIFVNGCSTIKRTLAVAGWCRRSGPGTPVSRWHCSFCGAQLIEMAAQICLAICTQICAHGDIARRHISLSGDNAGSDGTMPCRRANFMHSRFQSVAHKFQLRTAWMPAAWIRIFRLALLGPLGVCVYVCLVWNCKN